MNAARWVRLGLAVLITAPGCLAHQVARDGQSYRQAILAMYDEQIMDNLIRASENEPFVQVAYRDLYVQDEDTYSGSVQDLNLEQSVRDSGAKGALTSLARTFSNAWTYGAAAKRDRTMSFKADPITDKNDIYEAYLLFARTPELFVVTDTKPNCPVHRLKQCGGKYYWVPKEAGEAYMALAMQTTFMRGAKTIAPGYYERTVEDVLIATIEGQAQRRIMFKFDKPVKNGIGYVEIEGDSAVDTFRVFPVKVKSDEFPKVPVAKEGEDTLHLRSEWSPSEHSVKPEKLKGKSARVFLPDYPPPPVKPLPELQKIIDELTAIRANSQRGNNQ
jgi:hypothetical protein